MRDTSPIPFFQKEIHGEAVELDQVHRICRKNRIFHDKYKLIINNAFKVDNWVKNLTLI